MLEDEKYQREAFKALLLHQDYRVLEITDQTVCHHNYQDEKVVAMETLDLGKLQKNHFSRIYAYFTDKKEFEISPLL